jgi:hypothetical protein
MVVKNHYSLYKTIITDINKFNMNCNMHAFFSFDLFMVYIPECKQQSRTMKQYTQIRDIAHFKSCLLFYYSQRACNNQRPICDIAWQHSQSNKDVDSQCNKHVDSQSNKHVDSQSNKHVDSQSNKHVDSQSNKHVDSQSNKHVDSQSNKHVDSQCNKHVDSQCNKHVDSQCNTHNAFLE